MAHNNQQSSPNNNLATTNNQTSIEPIPILKNAVKHIRNKRNMTEDLKQDKNYIEQLVQQDGLVLKTASPTLKNNKDLVMKALMQNGLALQYASDEMRGDRQVVSIALDQNGMALEFCSKELRNDKEILQKALQQNVNSLKFMDNHWRKDIEIIGSIIEYGRKQIKFDYDLNEVLSHYNDKFIADSTDFKCDIFCKYWKSKEYGLFSSKQYPKELVLQFILLRIFFKFHKYHSISFSEYPSPHRTDDYYIFSDSIGAFIDRISIKLKTEKINHKKLKSIVKEYASEFILKNLSGKSFDCVRMFVSDWVNDEYFPTMESFNGLYFGNRHVRQNVIREYCERIRKIETFERYHFLSILGEGSQGVVLSSFHPVYKNIAFKIGTEPVLHKESFETVFKLLRSNKQGFTKSFECGFYQYLERSYSFLVMEIGKDTLDDYIDQVYSQTNTHWKPSKEDLIKMIEIFLQILNSVMILHNSGLTHRDLDPKNILRTQDNKYKLIDLENSRVIEFGKSITMTVGKYPFMAPETHDDSANHQNTEISKYSDIFSLGCILFKILTGCPLQIDKDYLSDMSNTVNPGESYFSKRGVYFHAVLSSGFGEEKLHKALFYQIQQVIDKEFTLELSQNKSLIMKIPLSQLLGQCIMTMIQIKPSFRLDCIDYIVIFQSILDSLQNGKKLQCSVQINKLKTQPQDSIEKLYQNIEERDETIRNLMGRIKQLEEENQNLTHLLNQANTNHDNIL